MVVNLGCMKTFEAVMPLIQEAGMVPSSSAIARAMEPSPCAIM